MLRMRWVTTSIDDRISQTPYESLIVRSVDELDKLLSHPDFGKPDKLRLVEIVMPRNDMPPNMTRFMSAMPRPQPPKP